VHTKRFLAVVTTVLMTLSLVAGAATAGASLGPAGEVSQAATDGPTEEVTRAATSGLPGGTFADAANVSPSETWRVQVDTDRRGPQIQVADGSVYAVYSGTVEALDAATGDQQWTERFSADFIDVTTDDEGRLYVSSSGYIRSLEQSTGGERWNVSMDGTVFFTQNGVLYVDQGRTIKALDTADGSELWTDDTSDITRIIGISSGTLLVSSTTLGGETRLRGLDASSGTERWKRLVDSVSATVTLTDGTVYSLIGSNLSTYDIGTGNPVDNVTLDGRVPRFLIPAPDGDHLYGDAVVDGQDFVLGYEAATGQQVANVTSTAGASGNLGFPYVRNDRVYVLDSDAGLRVLNTADGTQLGAGGPATFNSLRVKNGAAYYSVGTGGESGDAVVRVDIDGSGAGDGTDDGSGSDDGTDDGSGSGSGLPTAPGEPSFPDVLDVISAFNNNEQFNGTDVGFPDVLDVISAFNAG
jgi:outer membrane protein assembly factor BamB